MQTVDACSTTSPRARATRSRVARVARWLVLAPLALAIIAGCAKDGSASRAGAAEITAVAPSGVANAAEIPAANGVSVTVLSRVTMPSGIDVSFRIKAEHATEVVHVDDPSDVIVAKIVVQPGGSFGWHTHHGPAIVTLAPGSGALSIADAHDCSTEQYAAGQGFVDAGQGHVHVGYNADVKEVVAYVTFLDVPPGSGPTIPAQGPHCS